MIEHDIQNLIRLKLSDEGYTVFRVNVGKFKMADGRWFDCGLPRGFSDLIAFKDGKTVFIEVKKPGGKVREDQINFLNRMKEQGFAAGIVHSVEEAIELVNS